MEIPTSTPESDVAERVASIVDHVTQWRRQGGRLFGPWFEAEDLLEGEDDLTVPEVTPVLEEMVQHGHLAFEDTTSTRRYRESTSER